MRDENSFLQAIRANRHDDALHLVYADWLEDRGDIRAEYLRLRLAVSYLSIDHVCRPDIDDQLSRLRRQADPAWIRAVGSIVTAMSCSCYRTGGAHLTSTQRLHNEVQDTQGAAWSKLCHAIDEAVSDGREEFVPLQAISREQRAQIVTLPASIGKLKKVRRLILYGSSLSRIPPEIGEMTSLERMDPYTSYPLHWFPYQITRCENLSASTVSTRALYGNYKARPMFPPLRSWRELANDSPEFVQLYERRWGPTARRRCCVCDQTYLDEQQHRVWISLRVGTDVLPLLVNACSKQCIKALPTGADNHVQHPHRGGPSVVQPSPHL